MGRMLRAWSRWGILLTVFLFCVSFIDLNDAEARRGRRGLRRGGAGKVRGGPRARQARRRGNRRLVAAPANGNGGGGGERRQGRRRSGGRDNFDLEELLGISRVDGFSNLGRDRRGRFFEIVPTLGGSEAVSPFTIRQGLATGINGNPISGTQQSMLPETADQVRRLNESGGQSP